MPNTHNQLAFKFNSKLLNSDRGGVVNTGNPVKDWPAIKGFKKTANFSTICLVTSLGCAQ